MRTRRLPRWMLILFIGLIAGPPGMINAQTACPLTPRLTVDERGQVLGTAPNNLRDRPARDGTLLGTIPGGGLFRVLEGPVCDPASGITWWQVDAAGQVGWTAEGEASTYYVEPVHPALLYKAIEFNAPIGSDGRDDLALFDLVTGENRVLTADIPLHPSADSVWAVRNFAWLPPGDRIAFTLVIGIPFHGALDESVYLMHADGSGKCLLAENASLVETGMFALQPVPPEADDGAPLALPPCENPPEIPAAGWHVAIEPPLIAFAVNTSTGERIQLTEQAMGWAGFGAQISPDGSTAAVRLTNKNYDSSLDLIPLADPAQAARVLLSSEPTGGLSWSPDGTFLLVAGKQRWGGLATTLTRLEIATGEETILYTGNTAGLRLDSPSWSPSGAQIAFADGAQVDSDSRHMEPRLFLMNADGSDLRQLETLISYGPILWRPE
jgi:hypothetical protein